MTWSSFSRYTTMELSTCGSHLMTIHVLSKIYPFFTYVMSNRCLFATVQRIYLGLLMALCLKSSIKDRPWYITQIQQDTADLIQVVHHILIPPAFLFLSLALFYWISFTKRVGRLIFLPCSHGACQGGLWQEYNAAIYSNCCRLKRKRNSVSKPLLLPWKDQESCICPFVYHFHKPLLILSTTFSLYFAVPIVQMLWVENV